MFTHGTRIDYCAHCGLHMHSHVWVCDKCNRILTVDPDEHEATGAYMPSFRCCGGHSSLCCEVYAKR